jgi:Flp pilus assembly protein TadD
MLRLGAALRLLLAAVTVAALFPRVTSSWAGSSEAEICDVDADSALGLEDYPAAIALHREVLRNHSDNALAHYHLGFAYGMTGRTKDEINEYLTATRLGCDKWDLFLNLGLAYLTQNDWPNAIKTLQTAAWLGPDHSEAHFNLALAYEKGKRLREAQLEIATALRLAPEGLDEHNTKAIICAELGDLACARDEWARLVQIAPDYAPARVNLAILDGARAPILTTHATYPQGGPILVLPRITSHR